MVEKKIDVIDLGFVFLYREKTTFEQGCVVFVHLLYQIKNLHTLHDEAHGSIFIETLFGATLSSLIEN